MRRLVCLLPVVLAGCSTAPIAGFLDCVAPSRARSDGSGDRIRPPDVFEPGRDRDRLPPPPSPLPVKNVRDIDREPFGRSPDLIPPPDGFGTPAKR
jgi:hypothetical protein